METYTLHMDGKKLNMDIEYSLDYGAKRMTLTGTQK